MKAYLITHLILYAWALAGTKRERDPYSNWEMAILFFAHSGFIAWTIYLVCGL